MRIRLGIWLRMGLGIGLGVGTRIGVGMRRGVRFRRLLDATKAKEDPVGGAIGIACGSGLRLGLLPQAVSGLRL